MALTGIFRKLFGRKTKTVILDSSELSKRRRSSGHYKDVTEDKSIFEIVHSTSMGDCRTLISGRVKRGIFRTGDTIGICNPLDTIPKLKAVIMDIKTVLVDVNRVGSGTQAEFVIDVSGDDVKNITPGDRAYKIKEENSNVI